MAGQRRCVTICCKGAAPPKETTVCMAQLQMNAAALGAGAGALRGQQGVTEKGRSLENRARKKSREGSVEGSSKGGWEDRYRRLLITDGVMSHFLGSQSDAASP